MDLTLKMGQNLKKLSHTSKIVTLEKWVTLENIDPI